MRLYLTLLAVLVFNFSVFAQDFHGNHGQGHETWHKRFYEGLQTPDTKVSCCNLNDCRPTQGREKGGHYEVEIDGRWIKVLVNKIVKKSAPDGGFHVCAPANFSGQPEHVYCVIVSPEG